MALQIAVECKFALALTNCAPRRPIVALSMSTFMKRQRSPEILRLGRLLVLVSVCKRRKMRAIAADQGGKNLGTVHARRG